MNRRTIRKLTNILALGLSGLATAIGLFFLGAILWTLIRNGLAGVSLELFTAMTPPPGASGGLLNAIYGSVVMTVIGILIGGPVGMLAGTYLAEYARTSRLSTVIRFVNDVLLSAPSIIIGLFVYELLVIRMGHFSAIAGAVALAIIAMPVTVRTTEDMLSLVPQGMKDASTAMGAYPWRPITSVIYPAARSGILLLFTALNNQFWSSNLAAPMANLPVVIFQFALSPYPNWQQLAWSGALLITLSILVLSVSARLVLFSLNSGGRH